MQATHHHTAALAPVPVGQLIRSAREREMHCNSHHFWKRISRWGTLKKVFVPVSNLPMSRSRAGDARQCKGGCQYMLGIACPGMLGIERIGQPRVTAPDLLAGTWLGQDGRDDTYLGERGCALLSLCVTK